MGKSFRRVRTSLIVFAVALLMLVGLAGCSTSSTPTGNDTLKVGVRADVVGFGYLNDQTGKYSGLEIDIAQEMANRLGYKDVEFVTVLPENRKDMLQNGEVDCLVACYSISDTRLENFDFSPSYYKDSSIIMLQNSSLISSVDQLKGQNIGAMSGSNTAPQLVLKLTDLGFTNGQVLNETKTGDVTTAQYDTFTLTQLPSYQDLSDALEAGTIDAAAIDGAIAGTYKFEDRNILPDFSIQEQDYGVATQKDSALSQPVADTIQAMLDDGTIADLVDKWD